MIEEKATVVSVDEGSVIIETVRTSACAQCSASDGCGQKSLSEWAASKMTHIHVANPLSITVQKGDQVIVGIDEGGFLKASSLVYFVPLMMLFVAGFIGQVLGMTEPVTISLAGIGLILGLVIVKTISQKLEKKSVYQPVLLRISSS